MKGALLIVGGLLLAGAEHTGGWLWTVNLAGVAMIAIVAFTQTDTEA